jgi:multicomponent Na+:H+ antiporter subunit C
MEPMLAFVVGALFTAAIYMILRRSIVKLVLGLVLLSNAANLLLFTVAGLTRGAPPLIPEGLLRPDGAVADPLPQALILTAIVISFGVLAFAVGLAHRTHKLMGADDFEKVGEMGKL